MIPDTAVCYVEGYGVTTVGQLRAESPPEDSQWELDLRMLERIATENLCREPGWEAGATPVEDAA